jgi:hypothetical protein
LDEQTVRLQKAVAALATLVRLDTGAEWFNDAGAHWIFRCALTARLQRLRPEGERQLTGSKLPKSRLVASVDLDTIGLAIEAMEFNTPKLGQEEIDQLYTETVRQLSDGGDQ